MSQLELDFNAPAKPQIPEGLREVPALIRMLADARTALIAADDIAAQLRLDDAQAARNILGQALKDFHDARQTAESTFYKYAMDADVEINDFVNKLQNDLNEARQVNRPGLGNAASAQLIKVPAQPAKPSADVLAFPVDRDR